jgi:hypothetical protein
MVVCGVPGPLIPLDLVASLSSSHKHVEDGRDVK